jgi:hypothetical protein
MTKPLMALALLVAMPLASATAKPPPSIDACALLDAAQIAQVLGQAVDAGVHHDAGVESNGAWSSSCVWTFTADRAAAGAAALKTRRFVMLNAMQWPPGSGRAHEFLDAFRDAAAQGVLAQAPTVRPFGDEALWWGDGLAVRQGDVSFGLSVHVPRTSVKTPGAAEERLVPLILNKLDGRAVPPSRKPNSVRS